MTQLIVAMAQWLNDLFVLFLVAGVPVLSFLTARRSQIRLLPRRSLYFSATLSQWILVALGAVVVWVIPVRFSAFGAVSLRAFLGWTLFLTVVSVAAMGLVLLFERRGWWPAESDLVYLLVPETREEKLWAVLLVAPTAACCEEFLYRGYLLAQLSQWFDSPAWGCAVSSVAFGMAHAYQRFNGMARASLLGAFLAFPVIRLGSLYPSMAAHFLIDGLALAWLGPKLLGRRGGE